MNSSTLDRNYRWLHQTIGRVHIPAEPIHTAVRVYRHFVNTIVLTHRTKLNIHQIANMSFKVEKTTRHLINVGIR